MEQLEKSGVFNVFFQNIDYDFFYSFFPKLLVMTNKRRVFFQGLRFVGHLLAILYGLGRWPCGDDLQRPLQTSWQPQRDAQISARTGRCHLEKRLMNMFSYSLVI